MHEMGIVLNIVREAERQAEIYHVKRIGSLTLEVGELTGAEPQYIRNCFGPPRLKTRS
jgi:Zn finger protein HypA/HybF involved in hydrogenase expression